ncbi:MAG: protein kinase domain-containing protein [Chlamydiia bacterium]
MIPFQIHTSKHFDFHPICITSFKGLEPYLYVNPIQTEQENSSFSHQYQLAIYRKASKRGIAPPVYRCPTKTKKRYHDYYIVRFASEGDLPLYIGKTPSLNFHQRLNLANQLCEQLARLHDELLIFHCNLNPHHILINISKSGAVKLYLTDFKYATYRGGSYRKKPLSLCIPPEYKFETDFCTYKIPEKIFLETPFLNRKIDLYALGESLFFIFTGSNFSDSYQNFLDAPQNIKFVTDANNAIDSYSSYLLTLDSYKSRFIRLSLKTLPTQIIDAITGLVKTNPADRISIQQALELLDASMTD